MAYYENKYLFKFESCNGTTREIRVLHLEAGNRPYLETSDNDLLAEHTGLYLIVRSYPETQRPQGRAPVIQKQQNGPICGTSLTFYAECNVDQEFMEFYTSDPKEFRVDVYEDETLLWQGFITPELYSEPDIAPPYDVQVVATDGLGELKLYDFAAQGTVTLRALLTYLLGYTGLSTDVNLVSSLEPGSRGAGELLDMSINLDYKEGETCYDVLSYLLDTLHATITRWGGAWLLARETNVTYTDGKVDYYDTAGNAAQLANSVQTLGKMYSAPSWPVGQLSMVINPARNKVTVQAPWHIVTGLQNSDMSSDVNWTKSNGATYDTDGYQMPQAVDAANISQSISMAGIRVPMSLQVVATALTSLISLAPSNSLAVVITYLVGNATYYLRKGSDGALSWSQEAPESFELVQTLNTWNATEIEAETFSVEGIPAFVQGGSFSAGTLTVTIIGYGIKVYSAHLDVVLPKGYQDVLRLNNGARGAGDEVEIAIGRETSDNAYYAGFLQGLLLDSGSVITSFSDDNFTAGLDYLSFIARDYALSVALPRVSITGTVYLEDTITMPPLVFTKGGLNYWLETWSWNMYEDELEIDARTLPAAQLTIQSETILESK